ncbi:MAG: SET domain-containing protein [Planctomycetota bacterium]|nr:SET domain-containing protein [Planctomycetota bacterium]
MASKQPAVSVRDTHLGKAVFARKNFRTNQVIGEILGDLHVDPNYSSNYCMELGDGRALDPAAPFRFVNHSCNPNCEIFYYESDEDGGPPTTLHLMAIRPIRMDEELTIDYAWPPDAAIPCQCGEATCRGWIVDPEELDLVLREQAVYQADVA